MIFTSFFILIISFFIILSHSVEDQLFFNNDDPSPSSASSASSELFSKAHRDSLKDWAITDLSTAGDRSQQKTGLSSSTVSDLDKIRRGGGQGLGQLQQQELQDDVNSLILDGRRSKTEKLADVRDLDPVEPGGHGSAAAARDKESNVVEDQFIVQFKAYYTHAEVKDLLVEALGEQSHESWTLLPRSRRSLSFPTDFALVKLSAAGVKSKLKALSAVRRIIPQRRFHGHLSSTDDDDRDQGTGAAAAGGNGTQRHGHVQGHRHQHDGSVGDDDPNRKRFRQLFESIHVSDALEASTLWREQATGKGVRVAVFDTGLRQGHSHFDNVIEQTNWTDEETDDDLLGHGTFVASVIGGGHPDCPGLAPDAELMVFRVFTSRRVSYTSWFLDAFNYAIHARVDILNLSIGGPDFMDRPFVEKVWELSANNVIVVSAIGNDGPLYGTLNNPADMMDVIGVGAIDSDDDVARFSSRGMTMWELPAGYGRVKPDLVTYGRSIFGARADGKGCKTMSGTSVASPVVAGAVAVLLSSASGQHRRLHLSPAALKQCLIESAGRLRQFNWFEQGAGKLDLPAALQLVRDYRPRCTLHPARADLTQCPYAWPYCSQPLYAGAQPVVVNVTILNGLGVTGELVGPPRWLPGPYGALLELAFEYSPVLWPWSGYLAVSVRVSAQAAAGPAVFQHQQQQRVAEGQVELTVRSPPGPGERAFREQTVRLPVRVKVVPTPKREQRLLWDQYHNLRYPRGYFPRDALALKNEPFDWNGDHPHTNFRGLYRHLRKQGYFVEVLGEPLTCFHAQHYGALLLVDPEDAFHRRERDKLVRDVRDLGLNVLVFADWHSGPVQQHIKFYDENTRRWWTPATGGANVPALNQLLAPFGVAFAADLVVEGSFRSGRHSTLFGSGSVLARLPAGALAVTASLHDEGRTLLSGGSVKQSVDATVLGIVSVVADGDGGDGSTATAAGSAGPGRRGGSVSVFGDSSCLDDSFRAAMCFWLLDSLLDLAAGDVDAQDALPSARRLTDPFDAGLPVADAEPSDDLRRLSRVLGRSEPVCERQQLRQFSPADPALVAELLRGGTGDQGGGIRWTEPVWAKPRAPSVRRRQVAAAAGGSSDGSSETEQTEEEQENGGEGSKNNGKKFVSPLDDDDDDGGGGGGGSGSGSGYDGDGGTDSSWLWFLFKLALFVVFVCCVYFFFRQFLPQLWIIRRARAKKRSGYSIA